METATKQQLLQIALFEDCEIDLKYAALRELNDRYIPEEIRADIIYRLGICTNIKQVATENGLSILQIQDFLRSIEQKHKTGDNWMVGYKQALKSAGRSVYGKGA